MRVVSWNIHWGCGRDGRIRIHAIIDVLRKLNPGCDLPAGSGCQSPGTRRQRQREPVQATGGRLRWLPHDRAGAERNLPQQPAAPVRQHPAVEIPHHPGPAPHAALAGRPGSPSGMPRGMIETVLEAPGGKLRVLTTHLEYYSPRSAAPRCSASASCMQEACARAAIYQPRTGTRSALPARLPPGSAIFCGDFNFFPDSDDYRALLAPPEAARRPAGRRLARPPRRHGARADRRPARLSSGRTSRNATTISLSPRTWRRASRR
jgi:endonuclease/exonuclease/phosphatase family metal-dependent hydrolase